MKQEFDRRARVLTVSYGDMRVTLPARLEVCERCEGNGTHTNPSIDGNGLPDDWVSDPDFMDDYRAGVYDVTCSECDGLRVAPVVDEERALRECPRNLRRYHDWLKDEADYRAECEMERRMGC